MADGECFNELCCEGEQKGNRFSSKNAHDMPQNGDVLAVCAASERLLTRVKPVGPTEAKPVR
jgi:hypothetical protein